MAASGEGRGGCETAAGRLERAWNGLVRAGVFGASLLDRIGTALCSGTHLYSTVPLRALRESGVPIRWIEDLEMPLQSVAVSIERAAEHWFTEGPLIEAVLASCAVPACRPRWRSTRGISSAAAWWTASQSAALHQPGRDRRCLPRVRAVPVRAGARHRVAQTEPRCPYHLRCCDGL
jgi:hypothetical protein